MLFSKRAVNFVKQFVRNTSVSVKHSLGENRMYAWQIHSYGEELQLTPARIPVITNPTDVLVKVQAASVNPIDCYVKDGYGRSLIGLFRREELEFPLTLGRDFSGVIVDKGHNVGNDFKVGDLVYGIVPIHRQGSHAEAVALDVSNICHRPANLGPVEACSILYTAMTAWSALYLTGELLLRSAENIRVLVIGASGGVGTVAVQMLRFRGAQVVGTCSTDAVNLVKSLGANEVFDYTSPDYIENVANAGKYDLILDCAKFGYQNIPNKWNYDTFITLNSPLLVNTDKHGILGGLAMSARDLLIPNISKCSEGKSVRWAFFTPSNTGLKYVDQLIRRQHITPTIHKVFGFEEVPEAYKTLAAGHLRGKIVIDYRNQ